MKNGFLSVSGEGVDIFLSNMGYEMKWTICRLGLLLVIFWPIFFKIIALDGLPKMVSDHQFYKKKCACGF